jgi:RimJ/RimL family protein N-acetyltransferase
MIATPRLILRPWTKVDVPEFVRVTNTPSVMEYLGGVQEADSYHGAFLRAQACQARNGFSFWITERRSDKAILGFCGLKLGNVGPIVGEIEIGWRLREDVWDAAMRARQRPQAWTAHGASFAASGSSPSQRRRTPEAGD